MLYGRHYVDFQSGAAIVNFNIKFPSVSWGYVHFDNKEPLLNTLKFRSLRSKKVYKHK